MWRALSKKVPRLAGVAVLTVILAGCQTAVTNVKSFSELGPNTVVLVGRIELVPPLEEHEQNINVRNPQKYRNRVYVVNGAKYRQFTGSPNPRTVKTYFTGDLEKTFYIRKTNTPLFIQFSMIYRDLSSRSQEMAYLPGGLRIPIRPGDKAVYMGTLRFHRSDSFDIKRVQIIDNFRQEGKVFRALFGTSYPLVRRIAEPAKQPPQ